jgi:hypothetical protein
MSVPVAVQHRSAKAVSRRQRTRAGPSSRLQTVGERRPVGDCAAVTAPRQVPPARAGDRADQHPARPQDMPARAMRRWPYHPRARRRPHQLADHSHVNKASYASG